MDASEQRRKAKAQNRKAKFLATQAALPEHERLDAAARDWDVFVWRQLSHGREHAIAAMKNTFVEFLTDEDLPIKLSPDAAAAFFKKGGSAITTRLIRMFIEFMAQSRTGLHPKAGGMLKQDTVHAYVATLGIALWRAQNPIEGEIRNAAHAWIDGYLIPKGMVTTLGKEKYTCYDISILVRTIFSPEYTATMPNTRAPLQVVLFLTLATDCSGRVGEFVATHGKKNKPTYLRWRHATITAFRTPAGVTLRGTLRFENLKDYKGDPNKHKTIPLRLLPLELASEDSFRLLLILGLIDQVFEGLHCWEDIQRLNPGPAGSHVRIKQSALDLPIFRAVEKHSVTTLPMGYHTIHSELGRLGRYMGLEHRLLCGAVRRGAAYLLAMNCTEEERCARMGHKKGDGIYWNHYRNETSTVDFQAIAHNVAAEDVASLSNITINRRPDAPTKPSQAAYREMWQLPHITELRDSQLLLFDKIISTYGSMKQARAARAIQVAEYDSIASKYKQSCGVSIATIFRRDLAEFFASDCPQVADEPPQVAPPSTMDEITWRVDTREENSNYGEDEMTTPISAASSTRMPELSDALIDPALLGETSRNLTALFEECDPSPEIDDTDSLDVSLDHPPEVLVHICQYRTGKTVLRPVTLTDPVSEELLSGAPVLSDSELAGLMISSFNHMYPSDHFQRGQEPIPGTRNCRFCGEDFLTLVERSASRHSHWCQKRALAIDVVNKLDINYVHADKCSWVGRRAKAGQSPTECGRTKNDFQSSIQWSRHLHSHVAVRGSNTTIQCRFGDCAFAEEQVQFKSFEALDRHTTMEHRLRLTRAESGNGVAERFIWWCPVCFRFVNQLEEDIDKHARSHISIINDLVRSEGYTGLLIDHLAVIPVLCIFCVHDTTKSDSIRFNNWLSQVNHTEHIYQHINSYDSDILVHCPASIDTGDGIASNCSALPMKPAELTRHLSSVHGVRASQRKKARLQQNSIEQDAEDSDQPKPKKGNTYASHRILQVKLTNNTLRNSTR